VFIVCGVLGREHMVCYCSA